MIIPTTLRKGATASQQGELDVDSHDNDAGKYISIWQDDDLIIVYADQVDALIEELKKFKENA
ncbi:hypothetical protein uav_144 [Pseudomonas phage UAVern]|uniref:Uncharacterized protein n=1 Tax=Pseudomonas phage UAVern TaxID=2856997 RepID=A0A975YYL6_9CAUD|nr:hypothetical protein uav_144 [Pseudomonas phage UAVern]